MVAASLQMLLQDWAGCIGGHGEFSQFSIWRVCQVCLHMLFTLIIMFASCRHQSVGPAIITLRDDLAVCTCAVHTCALSAVADRDVKRCLAGAPQF